MIHIIVTIGKGGTTYKMRDLSNVHVEMLNKEKRVNNLLATILITLKGIGVSKTIQEPLFKL